MDSALRTETSSQSSSPRLDAVADSKIDDNASVDSGFVSGSSSTAELPLVSFTRAHLKHLNDQLDNMEPLDILRFCKVLFPNLYQTTAFGLTGLVTIDMLSRLDRETPGSQPVDLIFLDTLYHFQETYDLVDRVKARYPNVKLHVFKPSGAETVAEFEETYGEKLYDMSSELYDWIAKVEPQQRSYADLKVAAVLTGRRRSQGGERGKIGVIEVDEERESSRSTPCSTGPSSKSRATSRSTTCHTMCSSTADTSRSATGTRPARSARGRRACRPMEGPAEDRVRNPQQAEPICPVPGRDGR